MHPGRAQHCTKTEEGKKRDAAADHQYTIWIAGGIVSSPDGTLTAKIMVSREQVEVAQLFERSRGYCVVAFVVGTLIAVDGLIFIHAVQPALTVGVMVVPEGIGLP